MRKGTDFIFRYNYFYIFIIIINMATIPLFIFTYSNDVDENADIQRSGSNGFSMDLRHVDGSPFARYVRVYLWKIRCQCEDSGGINNDVEMFFEVDVNDAVTRFPSDGYHTLAKDAEWEINEYVYEESSLSGNLRFNIHVWDDDSPMPDDDLGEMTDIYTPQENFGDIGNMGAANCYRRDHGDWSVWYWVEVREPPKPPLLSIPFDNQTFNTSFPTFSWNFNPGDDPTQGAFCVQIDDTPFFSSVDVTGGDVESDSTSWVPPGLEDGKWYWRVCTSDSNGAWGNWSDCRGFIVDSTPPSIDLISPQGGEVLFGDIEIEARAIDTVSGIEHIDFYYKVESVYIFIGSDEIPDERGYYSVLWNTSSLAETDTYHVKVVGFNGVCLSAEDRTARFFEINRPDIPVLDLQSPVGGENYTDNLEVQWMASDDDPEDDLLFKVSISNDSGLVYMNITGWLSEGETMVSPGFYNYSLDVGSYLNSTMYRIRVCATDSSTLTLDAYASSTDDFTIHHPVINHPPEVYLTCPFEGRFAFEMTIMYVVTDRNRQDDLTVDIFYQFEGSEWQIIVTNSGNTGEYLWDLEDIPEGSLRLKIIARDGKTEGIWEMPDYSLSIFVNRAPKAVILSPQDDSILTDKTLVSFSSGSYDDDNQSINQSWHSNRDGIIYEGRNSSFSRILSVGRHTISLRVTDEYMYSDEKRITVMIRHFEDIYFEDIYVESISFPETAMLGTEVNLNFTLRNNGNMEGNVSFVLSVFSLGSDDESALSNLASLTSPANAREIFHGIVIVPPGDVFLKEVSWTFVESGYHVVIGIIEDENRSNDLEPKAISIVGEERGSEEEQEQYLEPFFYIYGIIISLLFLFGAIIIVHRLRRKKGENKAIERNLISASVKGVNSQFEPMPQVDEPMRERIKVLRRSIRKSTTGKTEVAMDERIGYGNPTKEGELSMDMDSSRRGRRPEENVKNILMDIMSGFEEEGDLPATEPVIPTTPGKNDHFKKGSNTADGDVRGTDDEGGTPLPKRVREIFEGL